MTEQKPKTVTVEAVELHTYDGKAYKPGDTYEIDEQYAESVEVQGKAKRKDVKKAASVTVTAPLKTTAVDPMGIEHK